MLLAAAAAWTLPLREPNCNTGSHYALVQAVARGETTIDAYHGESCDISWWHGHYYANKAPGLALVTVPWYLLLRSVGAVAAPAAGRTYPTAMRALPSRDLWLMAIWGAVLPSLVLLVLVRRFADARVPGTGTLAAALLAFGTILLPFGGLFFSHSLGACLDFAAFFVATKATTPRRWFAAGLIAGAATVVEYPNALLIALLAAFVIGLGWRRVRQALGFLIGAAAGLLPLIAFDWWTFGSPFHLSYVGAVLVPGKTGHDILGANSTGLFGVSIPTLPHLAALLFGGRGLFLTAPVLALAPLGLRALARAGFRREVAFIATVTFAFLLYNAGYYSPAGGATPGPRFLIAVLPFLAVPVAVAAALRPLLMRLLLVPGSLVLFAADATQPLIGHRYTPLAWWTWLSKGSYSSTLLQPTGHGIVAAAVIASAMLAGLGASILRLGGSCTQLLAEP